MTKSNLRIIITGGAGGIAEATVQKIVEQYTGSIGLIDIDREGVDRMREGYAKDEIAIYPYALDLRDHDALLQAMKDFANDAGGLDVLFANAGIMTGPGPFEVEAMDAITRSIDLNFKAVAASTRAAWSFLQATKGQVIVNASGAGLHPLPSDIIYSSSKAAAIMFARASALRAEETGIRFNAICPGVVDTSILNDSRTGKLRDEVHFFQKHFELILPSEIADAVLNLINDRFVNGEVVSIDNKRKT